ncbi:MAG: hypothetical protein JNM07_02055 [Phycisphaerae bacterium]|nr:hypothetical protein [Phycisphaerae bacterium]
MIKRVRFGLPGAAVLALAAVGATRNAAAWGAPMPLGVHVAIEPPRADADQLWRSLVARQVARTALLDLKLIRDPGESDFRIAHTVLRMASTLAPQDADIARMVADAARAAGDADAETEALRSVVRGDASDTVAQLRLVLGQIGRLQSVEERLAQLERLTGDGARALDPSVRSRLALEAALLHHQRGESPVFARWLSRAIELDATNKDAALLAVDFADTRITDHRARLDLLATLLYADPLDHATHLRLARELAAAGAAKGAQRFYDLMKSLAEQQGVRLTDAMDAELQVQKWRVQGGSRVLADLSALIDRPRKQMEQLREEALKSGIAARRIQDPKDIRLTLDMERVRLASASAVGDDARTTSCMEEFEGTLERYVSRIASPATRPDNMTESDAEEETRRWTNEATWLRVWTGQQLDKAEAALAELREQRGINPDARSRLEGWMSLHKGDLVAAERLLAPLSGTDPLADMGMAAVLEARGDAGAGARYTAVARRQAGTLAGAWAATRAEKAGGAAFDPGPEAKALEDWAKSIPAHLDRMVENPRNFMSLTASFENRKIGPIDRAVLRVRLRNTAPIPLGVSPAGPINSQLLLAPRVDVDSKQVVASAVPEVVSVERRLRLMPREEIDVRVWADPGYLGWALELVGGRASRLRYRIIQGFTAGQSGGFEVGPHCIATESDLLERSAFDEASAEATALDGLIENAARERLASVLGAARWRILLPPESRERITSEQVESVAGALSRRYARADREERLLMLAMTPHHVLAPGMATFDRSLPDDADPAVAALRLLTRVSEPDDAFLGACLFSSDATTVALAEMIKERLDRGPDIRCYARLATSVPRFEPGAENQDPGAK